MSNGINGVGGVQGQNTTSQTSSSISTSSASSIISAYSTSVFTSSYSASLTPTSPSISTQQAALPGPSRSSNPGNLSVGTVAGAAVAAAVGGALIAFILTFMFMRRRSQKPRRTHRHSEKRHTFSGAKALLTRSSDDLLDSKPPWEKHLPQPADDNSIRLAIKTLLHQVELHVENFYTDSTAPSNMSEEVQTELLKLDSPFLPKPLAVLLPQARFKGALMKHCLAQLIVSNITTEGPPDTTQSFLPLEFIALPHAIKRTRSDPNKPAFPQSLSRWRVLTSYLHPAPASDPSYTTARDSAIAAAASAFCTAFSPWSARTHNHATRFQNLVTIMQSAADAGALIFAQPAAFSWTWNMGVNVRDSNGGREIVVTPGFVKVTDDDAKVLDRPQVMVQQVLHGI